jgi:hypothetical protein
MSSSFLPALATVTCKAAKTTSTLESIPRCASAYQIAFSYGVANNGTWQGAPHWRNELGKAPIDLVTLRQETGDVAMPSQDPVNGRDGPLLQLWSDCPRVS